MKQHFAYYKVSYFDAAEEVFAELQNGVCPSLLIVGLPAVNEQSVMLMIEARRFWTSLPILVTAAWDTDNRAPVFEGFKFVPLEKLEASPVAHTAGMLFGAERVIDPGSDDDDMLTLSDVLQLHAIQGSTGTLRFGGRSRARVSLAAGLPVTAKAGKRTGKKALTRLLRRSSLSRCIFDPEVPEDVEFEVSFDEMVSLFADANKAAPEARDVIEDVDDIDARDLLEEGGLETLLTLESRPTLERIEETMRLLMKGDSVGGNQDSIQLNTPHSEESGELASLVESYELAGGLDKDSSPSETSPKSRQQPNKALGKPLLKELEPPTSRAGEMNKKATLFISHDLIAAAAGDRDDDSEWSEFSEASEASEAVEVSDAVVETSPDEESEARAPDSEAIVDEDALEVEPSDAREVAEASEDAVSEDAANEEEDTSNEEAEDRDLDDDAVAENVEEAESVESVEDAEDAEDAESVEGVGSTEDAEDVEEAEQTFELLDEVDEQPEPDEEDQFEEDALEFEGLGEGVSSEEITAEADPIEDDFDDDDLLLPQFKVRDDADRGGFAQEATVKKKALPQQLRALDGHEGDVESAEDDEALAP